MRQNRRARKREYDADGSLTSEYDGTPSSTTTYSMDAEGNIDAQTQGSITTDNTYSGQQLSGQTVGSTQTKDLYDAFGNVNCVTVASYAGSTCPAPTTSANPLVELFTYDYKNRQSSDSKYNTSGSITDQVLYTYDALDRVVIQSEFHSSGWTSTWTIYEGDSTTVAREFLYNAQNPGGTPSETKNYAYDPSGNLIALSDSQGSTTNRYTTVENPQSSVSLLLNQSGSPVQSYGYSAYGQANGTLTQNGSLSASLNPYRFQSKRLDTTFNTYDMGARRYSLTTSRWQQQDQYYDAEQDAGLSQDATTADRYEFAGGNPVNYVEADGHFVHPTNYPLNRDMFRFISLFEGAHHRAYDDKPGRPDTSCTIGIGHKLHDGLCTTQDYSLNWSTTQMESQCRSDFDTATHIRLSINRPLSREQYYAVVDIAYIDGVGGVAGSEMIKYLNAGKWVQMYQQWNWDCNSFSYLKGACKRRAAEKRLFRTGLYPWQSETVPNISPLFWSMTTTESR